MKQNKIFILIIGLIIIGFVLYLSPFGKLIKDELRPIKQTVKQQENVITLEENDFKMELGGINTKDISLTNLKGKVIFINFWATWCEPCRQEMPSIQAIYNKYQDKMSFVTIALPARGENIKEEVKQYLKKNNYTLPVYELETRPSSIFEISSVPTTFIVDKKGNLVYKLEGSRNWDDEEINQTINKLIKE